MATQANAYYPILVTIFLEGEFIPHTLAAHYALGTRVEAFFTTPYSNWIHPQTGKPTFPLSWCARCKKEVVIFRMMRLEQPVRPGPIFLAPTEHCDQCAPRSPVSLVIDADGQVIRLRRFFYADGSPILVKDPKSQAVQTTDQMEFRIMNKPAFLEGDEQRMRITTQPYNARSTSRDGVPYASAQ